MTEKSTVGDVRKNRNAIIGLVLGIIGLLAWILPIVGAPITVIGLILSIKGLKSLKHKLAIIGIVLSSIGLFLTIVNSSIGAYQGATGQNAFVNKFFNKQNPQTQTELSDNNISKTELINQAVQGVKQQVHLPSKIDQVTTLVDVTAETDAIRYYYILSDIDVSKITNDLLKSAVTSGVCQNNSSKNVLNAGINMEYSYSVKDSPQKYFFSITKTDCH